MSHKGEFDQFLLHSLDNGDSASWVYYISLVNSDIGHDYGNHDNR